MKMTVQHYKQQLAQVSGSHLDKIKTVLEENLDYWVLSSEDVVIDLLDDKTLTVEDMLEALQGLVILEDNSEFKNAVLAMRLSVEKKNPPSAKDTATDSAFEAYEDVSERELAGSYVQNFCEGLRFAS